ncbi:MAG: response regulator [Myxococcales bacterium]|nr:response regulator [Myxococcales bacterium]
MSARTVLVVDDDPMLQKIYRRTLVRGGYAVELAADAGRAKELLGAGPRFDLVIADLGLPDVPGWALVEWLREHHPSLPVIVASGEPADPHQATSADHYLEKPFETREVLRLVAELCGQAGDSG